jgi:predicted membrane channel-forming protein YqfA (hemolysin III family)
MYSQVSQLQAMYGAYAGAYANSGLQWTLIVLDAALAALNVYAISQVTKGQYKLAKGLFVAMGVLGVIFLLRALSVGAIVYILLNAGLLAGGVWGWMLLSREEKGRAA